MWYEQLDLQEKSLVEQQVTNNKKSLLLAYVLWFFLGMTGAHRFYVKGVTGASIGQLIMFVLGIFTTYFVIGILILFILGIWVLIDAFLLPGMVNQQSDSLKEELARDLLATRKQTHGTEEFDF